jgi:single-strand DNA-binding protein
MSFNKVIMEGNLTSDPEVKQTKGGTSVCSFNIAVNRRYAKREGEPKVDFFTVVAWSELADFVGKYFKKGKPILVCGELQNRTWSDKDGNRRVSAEIIAHEVAFTGGKENASTGEKLNENGTQQETYFPDAYKPTENAYFEDVGKCDGLPF